MRSRRCSSMGLGAGSEGKVAARQRLELGEKLMSSKKLQMLAKLVGAFREVAFEARRKRDRALAAGAPLDRQWATI